MIAEGGRYPDPAVEVIDKRFAPYTIFNAAVERLWTGARWCEGPAWFGDARALARSFELLMDEEPCAWIREIVSEGSLARLG